MFPSEGLPSPWDRDVDDTMYAVWTVDFNNAHRITLKGGSMRRLYDSTKAVHNTPGHA